MSAATSLRGAPWLPSRAPDAGAGLRLFCFPYAGGGTLAFRDWQRRLPASVELCPVQMPGRETRLRERPFTDLRSLVREVARALAPGLDTPFALFGHSMGALISFELARELRREHGVEPVHLFVSGRRAPQIPYTHPSLHDLPEPEFVEQLRRLNGTPAEVFGQPELLQLLLPRLRADFQLCETYRYDAERPLGCPVTAFGGLQDPDTTAPHLEGWREQTASSFAAHMLPGDHFFLHSSDRGVLQILTRTLL
ncbi:MAG TPA: alpha/beta fold hydrolase [Pyrinomonadaceae bacterium]|nr:alpha/beta fold hydrolase [Pyrinomonadaceae bacterium]